LTDNEFKTIEALITYSPKRGSKPTHIREMFDGILWILCSGAPWRDLPAQYPPWKSVYHRFRYYQKHGILERVLLKAGKNRKVQLTLVCMDGSYIRAHRHAAGAPKKTGSHPSRRTKPNKLSVGRGAASRPNSISSATNGESRSRSR